MAARCTTPAAALHHFCGMGAPWCRCRSSGGGVCFARSGCRITNGQGVVLARRTQEMNDSHPSILYKTVRIPFVQYFQYLRRKHLSGIYPALENLYFVLEQHLNMIISKDIHPLNPLTQNHLPDRELRFQRFVVQLLQFRMGIHMTF